MKALLIILALGTTITVKERKATVPVVRKSSPPDYEVENPKPYPVTLSFSCVGDYEPVVFEMPARVRQVFQIRDTNGENPYCVLDTWKRSK